MKRHKMSRRSNRKNFRRGTGTHRKNLATANPMRGGIRL